MVEVTAGKISSRSKVIYELLQLEKFEVHKASELLTYQFLEQLEENFPINDDTSAIQFRFPSQFADRLNVHVNYLNRALKETLNKTTTEVITIRVLHEAKRLLLQRNWNISDIAYALLFNEPTHFNNFFKKNTNVSPSKFRQIELKRIKS